MLVLAGALVVGVQGLLFGLLHSRPKGIPDAPELTEVTKDPASRAVAVAPEPRPPTTGAPGALPNSSAAGRPAAAPAPLLVTAAHTLPAVAEPARSRNDPPASPPPVAQAPTLPVAQIVVAPLVEASPPTAPVRPELIAAPTTQATTVVAVVPTSKPTPRSTALGRPDIGRGLYASRCTSCHAISPRHYARGQWTAFFASGRHDRYEPLGDRVTLAEVAAIHGYLDENSADSERDQGAGLR
jgi:mono/diheme cytochrome c family protein